MLDTTRSIPDTDGTELICERSSLSGRAETGPRRRVLDWMHERILACATFRTTLRRGGGIWIERAPGDVVPACILRTRAGKSPIPGSLAGIALQVNFVFDLDAAATLDRCMTEAYFSFTRTAFAVEGFDEWQPTLEYYDTFSGIVLPHRIHGIIQFGLRA